MIPSILFYIELNCFSIAILFVILLNMRREASRHSFDQKLFLMLTTVNILLLSFDLIVWILDGKPGNHIRVICISAIVIYNILNPIICVIWYYYVDYYVYGNKKRIIKIRFDILLPVVINTILSVASIFFNIYFIFDQNNVYYRGRFIYALLGICLYIIVYTSVFLIRNRRRITRQDFALLIFFAVPPSVSGIIQAMVPGLNIIWITTTLSVYIIFINIQKEQMHTDYLTGVNNRRYLDRFLQIITKNRGYDRIAGIMIDIDSFKMINDVYGHDHGDQALRYTAQILRETFRKTDFIARYGGDEFIVVTEIDEPSDLAAMVRKLKENVSLFNSKKLAPYEIMLSIGYDCYEKNSGTSVGEFLKRIDLLMYADKQKMGLNNGYSHHTEIIAEKELERK